MTSPTAIDTPSPTRQLSRRGKRRLSFALAALACALSSVAFDAGPASASASGCTYGGYPVDRCVYVNGSSTWVNYVTGTIRYRTGLRLQIEIWGDGFYYRGTGNPYTPSDTTQQTIPINRNLADRSWVCVAARWTDGTRISPACVQIKR